MKDKIAEKITEKRVRQVQRLLFFGALCVFPVILGCKSLDNQGRVADLQKEKATLANQQESQAMRYNDLENYNRKVGIELATNQHQLMLMQDEVVALKKQLHDSTEKLVAAQQEKEALDKRIGELARAVERQGGIPIEPNNSLANLDTPVIPGAVTRNEHGNIHVELPGNTLFERGGAQLTPHGLELLRHVAGNVAQRYPGYKIVIESHANTLQQTSTQFRSKMDQTAAQAMMVFEVLTKENIVPKDQLSISACGTGRPLVSNSSEDGAAKNYRVELIVKPN